MPDPSPLWPATLHHFRLDSEAPEALIEFYRDGLAMAPKQLGEDLWRLDGPDRRLLVGKGANETVAYGAFALRDVARLEALQRRLERHERHEVTILANPSPLFGNAAFAVADPDGQILVFGVPGPEAEATAEGVGEGISGRTQHLVFASPQPETVAAFYRDVLGFVVSDEVRADDGALGACFLRSDEEHHSYAVFRSDVARHDHHALETGCWNDIRDWADHFATMRVPIWWGPGRHGPGNNLFAMVRDPDGNRIELSAEIEHMPREMDFRTWAHEEFTLNMWGGAWMRS